MNLLTLRENAYNIQNLSITEVMKYMTFGSGFKEPAKESENYMKFQDGENKFRVLSDTVFGWVEWIDKKPMRYGLDEKPTKSHDSAKPVKIFWAMIVWNYAQSKIQILEITQSKVRKDIQAYAEDKDIGAPYFYDIKVNKKGEGIDTKYVVMALQPKDLDPKIVNEFNIKPCNLNALFQNADPFGDWPYYTQGFWEKEKANAINF